MQRRSAHQPGWPGAEIVPMPCFAGSRLFHGRQGQDGRVSPLPIQLRHVCEVHPVDTGDHGWEPCHWIHRPIRSRSCRRCRSPRQRGPGSDSRAARRCGRPGAMTAWMCSIRSGRPPHRTETSDWSRPDLASSCRVVDELHRPRLRRKSLRHSASQGVQIQRLGSRLQDEQLQGMSGDGRRFQAENAGIVGGQLSWIPGGHLRSLEAGQSQWLRRNL